MSLLALIREASAEIGISIPSALIGANDPQLDQLVALANREGKVLASRYNWQALTKEATFQTVAAEDQGDMSTIAPGYRFILNDTIWNRGSGQRVIGPESAVSWSQMKGQAAMGPYARFRIAGDKLKFLPVPAAGQTCALEYVTENWALAGGTAFASDADVALIDEDMLTLGVIWRWKRAKGFGWDADYEEYEQQVRGAIGRDGMKPTLNLNGALSWGVATSEWDEWQFPIRVTP